MEAGAQGHRACLCAPEPQVSPHGAYISLTQSTAASYCTYRARASQSVMGRESQKQSAHLECAGVTLRTGQCPAAAAHLNVDVLLTMRVYNICGLCRNYHHHIVDILDRLSSGIRQKGGKTPIDIADIAQVTCPDYALPSHEQPHFHLMRRTHGDVPTAGQPMLVTSHIQTAARWSAPL